MTTIQMALTSVGILVLVLVFGEIIAGIVMRKAGWKKVRVSRHNGAYYIGWAQPRDESLEVWTVQIEGEEYTGDKAGNLIGCPVFERWELK